MPRFVILRHDRPEGEHFDFMLEAGDVLKTWALPRPPAVGVEMDCEALADHRLAYLDYEGPISGRSRQRHPLGPRNLHARTPKQQKWTVELAGEKIAGRATLLRSADDPKRWRFLFVRRRPDGHRSQGVDWHNDLPLRRTASCAHSPRSSSARWRQSTGCRIPCTPRPAHVRSARTFP